MWKTVDTNLLAECLERQDVIASAAFMYGPNTPLPLTRLTNHQQLRDACLALHEVLTSPKVKAWFAVNKLWFSRYTELVHQLADPPYACRDRLYSAACSRDDGRRNKATAAQKHWGLDWFRVIPTEPTVRAPAEASVESCLATPRYVLFNLANTGTWFTTNVLEVFRRYHDYSDHEDFTMLCDVRLCTARPAAPNLVVVKFNPLTNATSQEVWDFLRVMGTPVNKLHEMGYVSIGCAPCTRPVLPGQQEREGRWWWEDSAMKECGLHSGNLSEEQKAKQDAREATEEDIFTGGAVAAMTREEIEALNDEDVHAETTLAVLYAPWCPFCQAMQDGYEAAAERLAPKGVKVTKFRADGDQKEWCKETLSLASFPTVLLFPKGRKGYVKLGSERRDPDSLEIFVTSIVGPL